MNRWLAVAGLVFLAAALVFLNQSVKKTGMSEQDEEAAQAQQAQAQQPKGAARPMDPRAVLPPEETIGDPATAKHHIQVGWVYSTKSLQKPEALAVPMQAVRDFVKSNGTIVSAEIVDLDVPVEDRSPAAQGVTAPGIQMDGRSLYSGDLSDLPSPQIISGMLTQNINPSQ